MPVATAGPTFHSPGWLRSPTFDLGFIGGTAGIALLSGLAVMLDGRLMVPIMLADLWLLGYHHVASTFTRLAFDRESFRSYRSIVLGVPVIMLAGALVLILQFGVWSLVSLYVYWQWFHYARQSWGVAQVYRRKAGLPPENPWLAQAIFYLVPVWGILAWSYRAPEKFLGMPVRFVPVPALALEVVQIGAIVSIGWWLARCVSLWWQGRLPLAHTLYTITHYTMFATGYVLIKDLDSGWLTVNIWHNAQYIIFVWMFNNNRFKNGIDPAARFLSHISQTRNAWAYFLTCLGMSTAGYFALQSAVGAVPLLLLSYQVINFHHYVADGVIWKVRHKTVQTTLGIAG